MEINLFPKFVDEAATPVARSIGTTLSSIWSIVFGNIDKYAEKTQYKRTVSLNHFKEEIEKKLSSIPDEKLVEPPLHIVGPTLEASKYYFEAEELRKMFANLIASSINTDTIGQTHPSFVEVIKQLSPLDANNLSLFPNDPLPIANYRLHLKGGSDLHLLQSNVFMENQVITDIGLNAASITNLQRLGLVNSEFGPFLKASGAYEKFEKGDIFLVYNELIKMEIPIAKNWERVDIVKGIVQLTPYGVNFVNTCLK